MLIITSEDTNSLIINFSSTYSQNYDNHYHTLSIMLLIATGLQLHMLFLTRD